MTPHSSSSRFHTIGHKPTAGMRRSVIYPWLTAWLLYSTLLQAQSSSSSLPVAEQATELETVTVTSARYPDPEIAQSVFDTTTLERKKIQDAPQSTLDNLLRQETPGFSLFRRSGSATANPTTQGGSLRNIGPNGAGRVLVLLDGLPQNDPFGGWVYWSRLPTGLLNRATVVQGGGAGLYGNNALGGSIYLSRHEPQTLSASVMAGDRDTYEGTVLLHEAAGPFEFNATLHGQSTGGHHVVRADQRGPIDINADSQALLFEGGIKMLLESGITAQVQASWFEDERSNGTPYTGNRMQALDLSMRLTGPEDGDVQWETILFYQDRQFESTFSSVNEDRTAETPALDQYDVPAHSFGFAFTTTIAGGLPFVPKDHTGSKLLLGVDARWIKGETNEYFRYVDGAFLNQREAGGRQLLLGAFAEQSIAANDPVSFVIGGRLDYWSQMDGRRNEKVIRNGAPLLNESYADRDGILGSSRLGLNINLRDELQFRLSGYTGFRAPTLNELYRPFRVRNDITGANAALEPEQLAGVEAGFEWSPVKELSFGANVFWNRLYDAVANVTLLKGPATTPDGTFIPDGGVFRQRQNIDAVTTTGVELNARWQPLETVQLQFAYLFTHTEVRADSPELNGKELAQAPAHILTSAINWTPHAQWLATLQARYGSEQYEDDLNSLTLASYVVWDASLTYHIKPNCSIGLVVENLFDQEIETGRSGDGLVSIGAPRWIGIKMKWDL